MTQETPVPKLVSKTAYYHGSHHYSFRGGERAEIIGVRIVETRYGHRACFMLLYHDGMIDYAPLEDVHNYTIEVH